MLTKIIFTLVVVVAGLWFASNQRGGEKQRVLVVATPEEQKRRQLLRQGAYAFMAVMVIAASVMIYLELADSYETVTVHVVNTQSGERISYQARRDDVQAASFTTLEGRKVFVAGIERIEIEAE